MQANISVFAMVQKHRLDPSGRVPIVIRIDLNSKPAAYDKMGTKAYRVELQAWDDKRREVIRSHPNAALLNNIIKKRVAELEGKFILHEQNGRRLTKGVIKDLIAGKNPGGRFFEFCRKQIKDKYSNGETRRTYEGELTKLQDFRAEVSFSDIDYTFLQEYAAWMRDVRGNADNTIWKAFKFMNTMMNDALKIGGIIEENPVKNFDRGRYKQTPRTFLTKTDRARLEEMLSQATAGATQQILAYLLFMCYCGLRFEDAMSFDYHTHVVDDERIIMVTQKKEYQVNIKLYPKLREVLTFIRDNRLQLSNQKFNQYLKPIIAVAGIEKNVTAHVGRHSFGRLLAEKKVDKTKAQKLLGHFDKRSTDVYYHLIDTDIDEEVDSKLGDI